MKWFIVQFHRTLVQLVLDSYGPVSIFILSSSIFSKSRQTEISTKLTLKNVCVYASGFSDEMFVSLSLEELHLYIIWHTRRTHSTHSTQFLLRCDWDLVQCDEE